MGEPNKAEAGRVDRNPYPPPMFGNDGKAEWGDGSDSDHISGTFKSPIKKTDKQVPEAWDLANDDEAGAEHISKRSKGQRHRIKQRERRQKRRQDRREIKAGAGRQTKLDPELSLPKGETEPELSLPKGETDHFKMAKRHRLSPKERTIAFFMNLFKYDTRPSDWDLVCIKPGEYTVFPFHHSTLPLSGLSALVWETEYEGRRISCLSGNLKEEPEAMLIVKERELAFYRKHLRNKDLISSNWSMYLRRFNDVPLEMRVRVLYYGQLVLRRVIAELESQKLDLLWQVHIQENRKPLGVARPAKPPRKECQIAPTAEGGTHE